MHIDEKCSNILLKSSRVNIARLYSMFSHFPKLYKKGLKTVGPKVFR